MDSSVGLHRVREPVGVLPQAAWRLDASADTGADEVRIAVERLNLDAASIRQLRESHGDDGDEIRAEVVRIIAARGKMHNPVTGSGGMLIGTVDEVGRDSPLGLRPGDRVASLVSLTLTPLAITDGLAGWDGTSAQVPCRGHAVLFARSAAAVLPDDLDPALALAVLDVCGAPALTARVVASYAGGGLSPKPQPEPQPPPPPPALIMDFLRDTPGDTPQILHDQRNKEGVAVAVLGGAGKSGALSLAAARHAGATATVGVVPTPVERDRLAASGLADAVALADARDPVAVSRAVTDALGRPADVTVVCVDVPGSEHGAILATAAGGTVIFFSMATSFSAAALGAEGLAADITMLIGNGYVTGHAAYALDLVRHQPPLRRLIELRSQAH